MNGRCDNDPLDPADNVCDLCGGEFCDVCLITPRGRKKPWCKKCALDHSGVRGGVKTQKKAGKREARKRRQEIEEFRDQHQDGKFIFFDDDESDFERRELEPVAEEPEPSKVNRRKVSLGIRKNKKDDEANTATAPVISDAPPPTSDDEVAQPVAAPPPTAADAITEEPSSIELLARLQDHVPAGMLEDDNPGPGSFDFGSSPSTATMPALDDAFDPNFDPFALPGDSVPTNDTSFDATDFLDPVAEDALISQEVFDQPAAETIDPHVEPAPLDTVPVEPASFESSSFEPASFEPEPFEAPTSRPSLVDRLTEDAPVVPPSDSLADPISEAAFLGEDDTPSPADFHRRENDTDEFEPSGGDDTDETGNWIPPALRGMAPVEERESLSLPRRNRD